MQDFARSSCPIAVALDLLGDKWTLLVVRDLFRGVRRYNEFLESPENIPTSILADRLKRLQAAGLISKTAYQTKPDRFAYQLTRAGKRLGPVLKELVRWSKKQYPETRTFLET